jgi:2,3-bisphosphoglycerate-independent phosphoglycerate mutase
MDNDKDFIVVNFANGDMVGHTGNLEASIKAVECVDEHLGRIITKAKDKKYNLLITSDHGNCEKMKDEDGNILTNHTVGDVYCFIIAPNITKIKDGGLNNIAPTILKLMDIKQPKEMDEDLFY